MENIKLYGMFVSGYRHVLGSEAGPTPLLWFCFVWCSMSHMIRDLYFPANVVSQGNHQGSDLQKWSYSTWR